MYKLKKTLITGGLALSFALSSIISPLAITTVFAATAVAPNTQSSASSTSLYGSDRYETAAKMSQKGWPASSDYAILSAGMPANLIDALAAGPLAATLNAPILLSEGNGLNRNAKDELTRLKVKKVYITSGSGVIKQKVIDEVKTIASITEVTILGGDDASHTSVNIAKEIEGLGGKVSKVVVTGGAGADALSIAPIAGAQGIPILYNRGATLSNHVSSYLNGVKANLTKTYVIGGTGVISQTIEAQLPGSVERFYGQNRYDTNLEVLRHFAGEFKHRNTYVANGQTLADAVAGIPLAVQSNSPILLMSTTIPATSLKYAQSNLSPNVIGLGGESVVPTKILTELVPSEIISLEGSSKGSNDAAGLEQFNGIIKVTGDHVTLKNAKTNYSIYVQGDNATLTNLTVNGTIFLDPGDEGSATLQNVNATNIIILSGADQSIKLMDVIAGLLNVQSNSPNVRIDATGATRFEHTQSSSSAIFEAADGSFFGTITLTYSSQTPDAAPVVELRGSFPDTIEVGGGVTVIAAPGSNISNLAISTDNPNQTVTLQGNFNAVEVNSQANVSLGENTTIAKVVSNALANIVVPPSSSITDFEAGNTGTIPSGGGSVGSTPINSGSGSGSSGGSGGSATVLVSGISVTGAGNATTVVDGSTLQMSAAVTPANATNSNVTWSLTDGTGSATISSTGLLTATRVGTVTVKATAQDSSSVVGQREILVQAVSSGVPVGLEFFDMDPAPPEGFMILIYEDTDPDGWEGPRIPDISVADFTLTKDFGQLGAVVIEDIILVDFRDEHPGMMSPEYQISPPSGQTFAEGDYRLEFNKEGYQSAHIDFSVGDSTGPDDDVTPGEGGALPSFTPFIAEPDKIGGLYIEKNDRPLLFYYENNPVIRNRVEMRFLPPIEFGADSYTLQYSNDEGLTWANFQKSEADLTTSTESQDNFSLENPGGNFEYRLLVNGGPKAGHTSNVVEATLSDLSSRYTGWGLDESMFISGTMVPFVGRGLTAYFTVTKYGDPDQTFTDEHMTYQWYRVNPVSYALTAIDGATELTYITTDADVGYKLMIRATGDEINVGGYAQVISSWDTVLQNNSSVSNVSSSGFTLNMDKSVAGLTVSDLELWDALGNTVPITAVTQGANAAIYTISASMDPVNGPFTLGNNSNFWRITSSGEQGHMVSEGVIVPLEAPSAEASLFNIFGQTDNATVGGDGVTTGAAITWSITVPNSVDTLQLSDISVANNAVVNLYNDSAFSENVDQSISLNVGNTIAYIKVTAQDSTTDRYYAVTITRVPTSMSAITVSRNLR